MSIVRNSVAVLLAASVLSACNTPRSVLNGPAQPELTRTGLDTSGDSRAGERRVAATGIRTARKVDMYLRVQPDATGVVNAVDDGRFTYIVFRNRLPEGLAVFDADGKTITFVRSGPVIAFSGLHPGILVKTAYGYSFLAPNPRATAADRPDFDDDPDVAEARSRLEGELTQMDAMRHAIAQVERRAAESAGRDGDRAMAPGQDASGGGQRRSASDDAVMEKRPNGDTLIRIFFNDGKAALSKGDEGLQQLAREARGASEALVLAYAEPNSGRSNGFANASARADVVKAALVKNGIPSNRIKISAPPEDALLTADEKTLGKPIKRRVEVVLRARKP